MAKFKNIKKFNGNIVAPGPVPQTVKPQKPRRVEAAPKIVKPVVPLATFTSAPKEKNPVTPPPNKSQVPGKKVEVKTVIEERPVAVKDFAPKQKEAPVIKNKSNTKPRRIGTFVVILFFTVILQIALLVSLLYLSPSLLGK